MPQPNQLMNNDLRAQIVTMITKAGEGHIPSAFSIVDIIHTLYSGFLKFDAKNPLSSERDYFVLSKGHGCAALFAVLFKYGFITQKDLDEYGTFNGRLGGHPDRTKVAGAEASTGSLGHGFPCAVGIALGQKIQNKKNKVISLVGDGECHEGTVWESALVGQNLKLDNLCVVVDLNGSAAQILPHPNIAQQFKAFGWHVIEIDGHDQKQISTAFKEFYSGESGNPVAIIAKTIKGKGVKMLETHGAWHHKIPNAEEYKQIMQELGQ